MTTDTRSRLSANWPGLLLLGLLLASLGLRLWGIWFGLPFVFHNDEGFEIVRALQLGAGEFDFTRVAKGGYFYLLFVEYGVLFVVLFLTGVVSTATEFGEYYISDPSAFYLIGRATTAVIGTATVYLVYRLGKLAYSTAAGLIGAALLGFNILHSYVSHLTTVDVPMTFLSLAAIYFAARMTTEQGSHRDYWWAALMAAFATATKAPAILVLFPLLIAHVYYVRNRGGTFAQYFLSRHLWQAAAIFVGAYVITTPGIVVYFENVMLGGLGKFSGVVDLAGEFEEEGLDARGLRANISLFQYYYEVIRDSMTWPVFAVCLGGLLYAVWKHRPIDVLLVTFGVVVYVVMSSSTDEHQFFPRYILPALPIMALLGGRLLADALGRLRGGSRAVVAPALTLVLIAAPALEIAEANHVLLREDTRAIAREWFEANIPPGSKVFIEGSRTVVSNATIPLQNTEENLKESIEFYRDREPGKAKYFRMALNVLSGPTYDLVGVSSWDLQDLQYYKDLGIQYFVLRPDRYDGSRNKYEWTDLVENLRSDPDVELIKRFEPTDDNSWRSPLLEIYRVNSNLELVESREAQREPGGGATPPGG